MGLVKKKIFHLAGIYVALIALFAALLWLLQLIPNSWMTEAQESFQHVWGDEYIEGGYPSPMFATGQSDLDIYTDSKMYERLTADEGMTALEAAMDMQDYPRYWHGYLTVLKPLSIFFTYREIRYINMFIVNILLAAVAIMLYKHTGRQGGVDERLRLYCGRYEHVCSGGSHQFSVYVFLRRDAADDTGSYPEL